MIRSRLFKFNLLIFLHALVYLLLGPLTLKLGVYPSLIINEVIFFLIPGLVYFINRGPGESSLSRDRIDLWPVVLGTVSIFPLVLLANGLFLTLLSPHIELRNVSLEIIRRSDNLLIQILVLALLPALAEEVFFRGFIQDYYIQNTVSRGIMISGLSFALFHYDIQNFVPPLLFGIFLGLVYYGSRKLSLVILSHFLYNLISLNFLRYYNEDFIRKLMDQAWIQKLGSVEIALLFVLIFVGVIAAYLAFISLSKIYRGNRQLKRSVPKKKFIMDYLPVLCLLVLYLFHVGRL